MLLLASIHTSAMGAAVGKLKRWSMTIIFLLLVVGAVAARYVLFSKGILYGEAAARMASLVVAGVILAAGYLPLRRLRKKDDPGQDVPSETIAATLAGVLGLALTGYAVSQLLAPNTPVAAASPACGGTPVYGAAFFAKTQPDGVNARKGPGIQYPQVNRYGGNCTLGFDGYCIGPSVPDFVLGTPDQRWLIVHDRSQLVASAVVLSQSPESALGSTPSPRCKELGGLPQPDHISQFRYDTATGQLHALAPGAVAVGYGLASLPQHDRTYQVVALGTGAGFPAELTAKSIASKMQVTGGVWLGAAVCLADNVPVVSSLRVQLLTFHGSHIMRDLNNINAPHSVRTLLAEIACNSSGL
jgi:hypothetical protein